MPDGTRRKGLVAGLAGTVIDPSAPPPPDPRTELPTSRERQIRAVWNTAEYLGAPVPHW